MEAEDDELDWFNMNGSAKGTAKAKAFPLGKSGLPPKPPPPIIRFGLRNTSSKPRSDSGNRAGASSGPSLRDRIDMGDGQPKEYSHRNSSRKEMRGKDRRREAAESRRRDSDEEDGGYWSSNETRRDRGSRWRGGYER